MRQWIDLFEGRVHQVNDENNNAFRIFENPVPAQLKTLMQQCNEAKGVISPDGRTIYVWNAYYAHHMEALGLTYGLTYDQMFPDGLTHDMDYPNEFLDWACFFVVRYRNELTISTEYGTEVEQRMVASPAMRRMLAGDPTNYLYANVKKRLA